MPQAAVAALIDFEFSAVLMLGNSSGSLGLFLGVKDQFVRTG
jgi:hypothetical protein